MPARGQTAVLAEFAARWRRWTEIVRLFAIRKESRFAVDAGQYRALHAEMTELARGLASQPDEQSKPLFEEIEEILAPWVQLDALDWAEREIVNNLYVRCLEIQGTIEGGSPFGGLRFGTRLIILVGAAVAATLAGMMLLGDGPTPESAVWSIRRWLRRTFREIVGDTIEQRLIVGGIALVAVMMVVVWYSAKRS